MAQADWRAQRRVLVQIATQMFVEARVVPDHFLMHVCDVHAGPG
jgi:hypothetical protein